MRGWGDREVKRREGAPALPCGSSVLRRRFWHAKTRPVRQRKSHDPDALFGDPSYASKFLTRRDASFSRLLQAPHFVRGQNVWVQESARSSSSFRPKRAAGTAAKQASCVDPHAPRKPAKCAACRRWRSGVARFFGLRRRGEKTCAMPPSCAQARPLASCSRSIASEPERPDTERKICTRRHQTHSIAKQPYCNIWRPPPTATDQISAAKAKRKPSGSSVQNLCTEDEFS